jgi:hypothetical protein
MPLPLKIVQTKDEVIFMYETFHAFRVIPTDGRGHPDDLDPSFWEIRWATGRATRWWST